MFSLKNKIKFLSSIFFGSLSILFSVFIMLYITPIVIDSVGFEAYGFVSLSSNVVSYLQIITIALNAYAARYISIAYLRNDKKEFDKYFNTVLWGNIGLGSIILILFMLFTSYINVFLNVPNGIVWDVKILFGCVGINFILSLITVVWKVFALIRDRVDIINILDCISYILQIAVLFIAFNYLTPYVWYVGFAQMIATIFVLISSVILSRRFLPKLRIKASSFSGKAFRTLTIKGVWNSIDGLGNTLNSGLDLLVTDLMLSANDMGKVSVAKSMIGLPTRFYTKVSQVFLPRFINAYANNNTKLLVGQYKKAIKTCSVITNTFFSCFLFLGMDFIQLWIPNQDIKTIFQLTVLCMIPGVMEGMICPLYSAYTLTTKLKIPTIVTIISGLLNVISMFILLKYTSLGVYAIVITTAVIVTVAHWITPFYSCKCLGIDLLTFLPTIGLCLGELLINIIIFYIINKILIPIHTWWEFITNGIILGALSVVIGGAFIWVTNTKE